jgi:CubicO group peptidase (beta-lactamase class C family)
VEHPSADTVGIDPKILEAIDPIIQHYIDRGQLPGVITQIARRGKIAHQKCFGFADVERKLELRPDAIFRIYSMSKPVTAVAALILFERGFFDLYDPISAYIPSFANSRVLQRVTTSGPSSVPLNREISIRDLFMHTSGLIYPDGKSDLSRLYQKELARSEGVRMSTEETIDRLASLPLAFHPGERWHYGFSNDVLGRLIEVVTGKSFGEFLREEVFGPLGMNDTGFWVAKEKKDRLAACYEPKDRENKERHDNLKLQDDPQTSELLAQPAFESGGGGMVSTVGDYARFAQMLVNGGSLEDVRILGRKTVKLMARDHLLPAHREDFRKEGHRGYGFGLGVRVMIDPAVDGSNGSVGEFGWQGLASTWVWIDPREEMVGLFMSQLIPERFYPASRQFRTIMYAALR